MSEEAADPDEVLDLLNDEYARAILTATSVEPMSAKTLSDRCDASLPTIYRRTDRLEDCGLLREELKPDEDGNHYRVYAARFERLTVDLEDGDLDADVHVTEECDVADRFTNIWESI